MEGKPKSIRDTAEGLRLPVDMVRRAVRELAPIGYPTHTEGHWQRRLKPEEVLIVGLYCIRVLGAFRDFPGLSLR